MALLSFLADEHVKRSYVRALRAHGFEVMAVSEGTDTVVRDSLPPWSHTLRVSARETTDTGTRC